ncbi:hypothetical protein VNO78_34069 [Psophocarpus tetragonolobus]|uniref:Uncharacterized protein n=1 Tax=Psophocarpus tetragonolobus TaxID=3891 RepID=A0AAN9NY11_PSOTE
MKKKKNEREKRRARGRLEEEEEGGEEMIRCSGKHCGSCCGGYVADCVAVCCCPCAVLHCCVLAFVKGPSLVGRKCLGLGKKKNKKKGYEDVIERVESSNVSASVVAAGEIMDSVTINSGFDAEKLWRELYQIAHLDFGRVSSSRD